MCMCVNFASEVGQIKRIEQRGMAAHQQRCIGMLLKNPINAAPDGPH